MAHLRTRGSAAQLAEANAEKARVEESGAELRRQLSEAQELLRSNQQIIQWLNKELNDAQAGRSIVSAPSCGGAISRISAYRPTLSHGPVATASFTGEAQPRDAAVG